jgi:arylsulfatase A-like enzyme
VSDRPNIVLLMTDQHRADFMAGQGFPLDTMPFFDSVADGGMRFQRAYTSAPLCVPARCSLLTGRFPKVTQVRQNSAASAVRRGPDLVDVLRDAGYRLNFAGKTHFYREPADFDAFSGPYMHFGMPPGAANGLGGEFDGWLRAFGHEVARAPTPFPIEAQLPYRIVSDAIGQLEDSPADTPFFSWLSFPEPHNPYQVPEPYFSLFAEESIPDRVAGPEGARAKGMPWTWLQQLVQEKRPEYDSLWRRYAADYCGMLRLLDDQMKRFLDYLRSTGRADNTLIIVLADHGDYVGEYGMHRKGAGIPECLARIPFVIAGPGVRPRANAADFVSIVDVFPTICEALGADIPLGVQGRSLWPMLTGEPYPEGEFDSIYAEYGFGGLPYEADERPALHFSYDGRAFDELNSVTQSGQVKMLRRGTWKLIYHSTGRGELYDLAADPAELDNRWDDPALTSVKGSLVEDLLRWTIITDDDLPQADYTPKRAAHNWRRVPDHVSEGGNGALAGSQKRLLSGDGVGGRHAEFRDTPPHARRSRGGGDRPVRSPGHAAQRPGDQRADGCLRP